VQLLPFSRNQDAGLSYVTQLGSGRVVEMHVAEAPGGVSVEAAGDLSQPEAAELAAQAGWMLGLDQEFSAFYTLARHEPKLARAEARAQGRLLRSPTLFEDTIKTILTTNTTWSGTIRMVRALVSQFGASLPSDTARRAFPTPARLAETDAESLRLATGLGYRAPYVVELARAVASGALDLEALKTSDLPTPDVRLRLLAIKGVGGYAAANLLMLLARYDFIPVDSWALRLTSHEWHAGEPVGPAEVEAAFERWGEWKGLAFWLWNWSYTGS
jgi:3-methyladenine DNA glycosylase/8-oxoguanine DNA glycosylase